MDVDEENTVSASIADSSTVGADDQTVVPAIDTMFIQLVQPIIVLLITTPAVPPIGPLPAVPLPVPQPLATLPVRPPVVRPTLAQNETRELVILIQTNMRQDQVLPVQVNLTNTRSQKRSDWEMERRDHLRMLIAKLDTERQLERLMKAHEDEEAAAASVPNEMEEDIPYPFYTDRSRALLEAH
ncbi:unnamed protein product [Fraxinus pennsylvanica]|uniref:Uncharacterized protein n=1 Tax=Fraxinus pennsylvanica TaxID=56036 RepID=A0AAD1Z9H1_9LAMI|nr:unnamed protein product [Fraxinus pennsylvanica]